jgi:hypothetical protein
MHDTPVTRPRSAAKGRSEHFETERTAREYAASRTRTRWVPKQLQELLDEDTTPLTLSERMENWGSD